MLSRQQAKKLDKYYTNIEVAKYAIDKTIEVLELEEDELWLEPAAGSGAFSNQLDRCVAYDLSPEGEGIVKQDFLELELEKRDHITIGNPPFGTRSKLAIDFVNHAAKFSKAISFIVPITFMKWSVQKDITNDLKLVYSEVLPEDSFTFMGEPYELRSCLQIWVQRESYPELKDKRLKKRPPISMPGVFNIWQHNATVASQKYIEENWKYATFRQGYNDYNNYFTRDDYEELKESVYNSNKQYFYFEPLTDEAEEVFLNMDLNALSKRNMATPGFGKGDFVQYFTETKEKMGID